MSDLPAELDVYARIGDEGFARLVRGFYERVRTDDLLAPLYPEDDWAGAEERLLDFLVGRMGGPPRYMEKRGHPRLRMRHAPFPIDAARRDRWVELMDASLDEATFDADVDAYLRAFFAHVASFLINSAPA